MIQTLQFGFFLPTAALADLQALFTRNVPRGSLRALDLTGPDLHTALVASGPFHLQFTAQRGRLDTAIYIESAPEEPLNRDMDFEAAFAEFQPFLRATASALSVVRLALVTHESHVVASAEEAVALALARMPEMKLPPGATELDLRINMPLVEGPVPLNRNVRWQTAKQGHAFLQPQIPDFRQVVFDVFTRVVDVNTSPAARLRSEEIEPAVDAMAAAIRPLLSDERRVSWD